MENINKQSFQEVLKLCTYVSVKKQTFLRDIDDNNRKIRDNQKRVLLLRVT